MKNIFTYYILAILAIFIACQSSHTEDHSSTAETVVVENVAAPGFDLENSDPEAIAIADEVMEAMGGRAAWDQTDHIHWNFFGARTLLWSKHSGDVRIEFPRDTMTILMNIHTDEGRVMRKGAELTDADSLAKYLKRGKSVWINDSYWLVMPFKLKDSGVTLTYAGEDTTQTGALADVLELRFKDVGDTPQNKYLVYVDKEKRLVTQWAFFRNAEDEEPGFITPWAGYQTYGSVLLCGDRGESPRGKRELTEIAVMDSLPTAAYESFESLELAGK